MGDAINYREYLSIIYGDDIEILFDRYVFIYNKDSLNNKSKARVGKILYINGAKLITEDIDDVARIDLGNNEIVAYVIFLNNQLVELHDVKAGSLKRDKVVVISKDLQFKRGKITSHFYNKKHPELIIEYEGYKYIGRFNESLIERFIPIGWRHT